MPYYYHKKYPQENDIVIVTLNNITEYGVYCNLVEYNDMDGFIISTEIHKGKGRGKGRKDVKPEKIFTHGTYYPVIVLAVEETNNRVNLSYKKIRQDELHNDREDALALFKRKQKLFNLSLDMIAITGLDHDYVMAHTFHQFMKDPAIIYNDGSACKFNEHAIEYDDGSNSEDEEQDEEQDEDENNDNDKHVERTKTLKDTKNKNNIKTKKSKTSKSKKDKPDVQTDNITQFYNAVLEDPSIFVRTFRGAYPEEIANFKLNVKARTRSTDMHMKRDFDLIIFDSDSLAKLKYVLTNNMIQQPFKIYFEAPSKYKIETCGPTIEDCTSKIETALEIINKNITNVKCYFKSQPSNDDIIQHKQLSIVNLRPS